MKTLKSKIINSKYGKVKIYETILKNNLNQDSLQIEIDSIDDGFSGVCFLRYGEINESNINKIIERYCIN